MRHLLLIPAALALVGCAGSDGPDCGGTAQVGGTWEYHATRGGLAPATIEGTLEIPTIDGCEFSGTLSVIETPTDAGPAVPLGGSIFGIALGAAAVNFDAQLEAGHPARTHFGEQFTDSLAGEWIEGSGTDAPRGDFWARRTAP